MTPELALAAMLGGLPVTKKEKLAAKLESLDISELRELVKEAGVNLDSGFSEELAMAKLATVSSWGRELAQEHYAKVKEAISKEFVAKAAKSTLGKLSPAAGQIRAGQFGGKMDALSHKANLKNKFTPPTTISGHLGAVNRQSSRDVASDTVSRLAPKVGLRKSAGIGGSILAAGKGLVGKAAPVAKQFMGASMGTRAAIGAAGGGAVGAVGGALKTPQQGQSRLGNMATGAVGGAAVGGALGAGAQKIQAGGSKVMSAIRKPVTQGATPNAPTRVLNGKVTQSPVPPVPPPGAKNVSPIPLNNPVIPQRNTMFQRQ